MSMRRSRIKPAINLAASRRSAVCASSRPKSGEIKSTSKPSQPSSSHHSKITNKNELQTKEIPPPVSSEDIEEARADRNAKLSSKVTSGGKNFEVDFQDSDKDDPNVRSVKLSSKETSGKNFEVECRESDKSDPIVRTGEDTSSVEEHVETTKGTVPSEEPQETNYAEEQPATNSSSLTAQQEATSACSSTIESKGESSSTQETNKNVSQVRRKRITAVPNIGRRRLPSPVRETTFSRQKQSDGKTDTRKEGRSDSRKEGKVLPNSSEIQEEQGKKENKKKNVVGESKRKDSIDGEAREEIAKTSGPPTVQRKVLSQVFQPQVEQLQEEPPSLNRNDDTAVRKDARMVEVQENGSVIVDVADKSRKDKHHQGLPSSGGNIYQKRLIEMQEVKKEETPSHKRKKYTHDPENGIDTSKMKMRDLIYYNPKENKMLQGNENSKPVREKYPEDSLMEETDEMDEITPLSSAAPQVKIGPDGKIILDQQSLVKVVTPKRKLDDSEMTEVKEDSSTTTYSSFRKPSHTAAWTKEDTEKFYRAISTVGTDFSMINAIFPNRKRRELKNKFKREEKLNAHLMDKALRDVKTFDFSDFQNNEEDAPIDKSAAAASENDKNAKKSLKKKRRRKRDDSEDVYIAPKAHQVPTPAPIVPEAENIPEEPVQPTPTENPLTTSTSTSEIEPVDASAEERRRTLENLNNPFGNVSSPTEVKSSDEEEDYDMDSILGKPTRSGRKPKQREVFTIQESLTQPRVVRTNQNSIPFQKRGTVRKQKRKSTSKKLKALPQNPFTAANGRMQEVSQPPTLNSSSLDGSSGSSPQLQAYNTPLISNGVVLSDQNISPQGSAVHPHMKLEHYLVTYPDGRKTLIQMPASAVAENSFDFVLNVMPSPVREGGVLQLGVVPRLGSPSHEPSHSAAFQGGSPGGLASTFNHHSPSYSQLRHQQVLHHEEPRLEPQRVIISEDSFAETFSNEVKQSMGASEPSRSILQASQGVQSSLFRLHNVGSLTTASPLSPGIQFQTGGEILSKKILGTSLSQSQSLRREIDQRTEGSSQGAYSSIENSARSLPNEMVYVSDLVEPLPQSGSEVSDPIIAQQVDVSSSVLADDADIGESEAFVPI